MNNKNDLKYLVNSHSFLSKKEPNKIINSIYSGEFKRFNYIFEKRNFYKKGDLILIEYWYNDMITVCKIVDIIGRKYKVTHNIEQSKIKNAPDEIIKISDIIDLYKI